MAGVTGNIIRLTKADIKPAALSLAKAFMDYPESVYFIPDEAKRRKKQPSIYRLFIKGAIAGGEVYATSPKMEGVAVWQMVNGHGPAWRRGFSFSWWWLSLFDDKQTKKRRNAYFEYLVAVRMRLAPERYWYLQALGVDPVCQGRGFSSRLLRPMLELMDREGLPCYLETQLEKNIPFYEHFGFRVVEEGIIAGSNIHYWTMIRKSEQSDSSRR
jgi:GNAT superfamily N-acetyltransferase